MPDSTPQFRAAERLLPYLLVGLVFLVYLPVTWAGFIWDDDQYLVNNPLIRTLPGLYDIWFSHKTPQYYPAVFTTFWVEYQLYGLNPLGYHLVNVALHAASALVLVRVLRRLSFPNPWWVALLFAVHPVQVESVAWVTERKNVLSLLFYLFAFNSYLSFNSSRSRIAYVVALLAFALALLSKTVACTLPAALVVVLFAQRGKNCLSEGKYLAPFFVLGMGLGLHTAFFEQTNVGSSGSLYSLAWYERILMTTKTILFYLGKLAWPHPIIFNYPKWDLLGAPITEYFSVLLLAILVGLLAALACRSRPVPALIFSVYVLTLFPALGFFDVYPFRFSYVADHFQYHASPSGIALLVLAERGLFGRIIITQPMLTGCYRGLLLVALSANTWLLTLEYRDLDTLYTSTLAKNPCSTLALNNLGARSALANDLDQAKEYFDRLLSCDPNYLEGLQNRGSLSLRLGDLQRALEDYSKAIELVPIWGKLYHGRAHALLRLGRAREAFTDLNKAISLDPNAAEFYELRGLIYWRGAKDAKNACADWAKACSLGACGSAREPSTQELCKRVVKKQQTSDYPEQ